MSASRDEQIATLYQAGWTMAAIAEALGMSRSGVCTALKRLGIAARPAQRCLDPDLDVVVARRYHEGETMGAIAATLGISASTVKSSLRRTDVLPRPRGGPHRRADRASLYADARASGQTFAAIARQYGVTKQAVHAVLRVRNGYLGQR